MNRLRFCTPIALACSETVTVECRVHLSCLDSMRVRARKRETKREKENKMHSDSAPHYDGIRWLQNTHFNWNVWYRERKLCVHIPIARSRRVQFACAGCARQNRSPTTPHAWIHLEHTTRTRNRFLIILLPIRTAITPRTQGGYLLRIYATLDNVYCGAAFACTWHSTNALDLVDFLSRNARLDFTRKRWEALCSLLKYTASRSVCYIREY